MGQPTVVVVFMRGAVDGLNVVVPYGDPDYYGLRPTISIAPPSEPAPLPVPLPVPVPGIGGSGATALDLDGYFGLHPSMAAAKALYDEGLLACVQATGSPLSNRSHFSAQLRMEVGGSTVSRASGGWLGRYLAQTARTRTQPVRAVSIGVALDQALAGADSAIAVPDSAQFTLRTSRASEWRLGLPPLHAAAGDTAFSFENLQARIFSALDLFEAEKPSTLPVDNGAAYPADALGTALKQAAQYIKADMGIDAITLNSTGWDHHVNENSVLPPLLQGLSEGIAAFRTDLGARFDDVVLVTMSEFGRTVRENGSGGTDHGRGNMMLLAGGRVNGGRVFHDWPTLAANRLDPTGDLAITTDYRAVLGEVLAGTLGAADFDAVFPGYAGTSLGVLRG